MEIVRRVITLTLCIFSDFKSGQVFDFKGADLQLEREKLLHKMLCARDTRLEQYLTSISDHKFLLVQADSPHIVVCV